MKGKIAITIATILVMLGTLVFFVHRKLSPPIKDVYFVLNRERPPEGLAVIRPAHFVMPDARGHYWQPFTNSSGKPTMFLAGRGVTVSEMIAGAYGFSQARILFPPEMPTNHFDYLVTVPDKQKEQLQAMIKEKWGYTANPEKRDVDVLALKVIMPDAPGLQVSTNTRPSFRAGRLSHYNVSILVWPTENRLNQIIVNETGLTNYYDFNWNFGLRDRANIDKMLANLGLRLEPKTESVNVLVVEKK
jgi:uncharacterized protein (TIGR03435 family)